MKLLIFSIQLVMIINSCSAQNIITIWGNKLNNKKQLNFISSLNTNKTGDCQWYFDSLKVKDGIYYVYEGIVNTDFENYIFKHAQSNLDTSQLFFRVDNILIDCMINYDSCLDGKWKNIIINKGKIHLMGEKVVKNNRVVGLEKHYYLNGQPKSVSNYTNEGISQGESYSYYNNGNIMIVICFRDSCNGILFLKTFYENGELASYYQNGIDKHFDIRGNLVLVRKLDKWMKEL